MLLLVLTLAVFMPVSANAAPKTNQWVNKGGYRYYYNQKGKKVKNKVKQIGKFRYSFDKKGRMQTGWQIFGSKKAYFSKKSGRMQVNKKVNGVKIGKSGYVKRSKTELKEQKALEKAKQILAKITTSKMSDSLCMTDGNTTMPWKCTKREPGTATISHVDLPCLPKQSAISHRSLPAVSRAA